MGPLDTWFQDWPLTPACAGQVPGAFDGAVGQRAAGFVCSAQTLTRYLVGGRGRKDKGLSKPVGVFGCVRFDLAQGMNKNVQ